MYLSNRVVYGWDLEGDCHPVEPDCEPSVFDCVVTGVSILQVDQIDGGRTEDPTVDE